ncbi:MAG TPA: T9SS type A sorting domain-containing protein [Ignavibacteria bacterium]
MKKSTYAVSIFLIMTLFYLTSQAQNVTKWGSTAQGKNWPISWNATTGTASIGNGSARPTGWATIRGGFDTTYYATTSQAVIVSGEMEFVGGGGASAYTWLRYALTFLDSATLKNPLTDSAYWDSPKKHYGYEFCPRSGTGTMANGAGGSGTVWTVVNGSWSSNWSNGGKGPIASVKQAPRNAVAIAGVYNWAISVKSINDTLNEIRWYLVEKNNKYWFGGIIIDTSTTKKFNGINFGFNNDFEGTKVNFSKVKVELGNPITVPEAPWQAFYVEQWGATAQGKAWPIKNDSTYLVGDATIGNGTARPTGWATIRGGFGDPITITKDKAIIVSGQMEFVGGGGASAYTWLRYALTFLDSATLKNPLTDSAYWDSPLKHYGYEFCPRSGTGTMANGAGGSGTVWTVVNGSWSSNWSNGGKGPIASVKQAPRNAVAIAGVYNWAISVKSVNDTLNEIRWYLVEKNNKYWFGGTIIDTSTTKKFNGINFGFNNDFEGTKVNLIAVKVDMGNPITVPAAPWQAYYLTDWGFDGGKISNWKYVKEDLDGNATISGSSPNTSPVAIRGALSDPITPEIGKALTITGSVEFVGGGFETAGSFRFGMFYTSDAGSVISTNVDSTRWSGASIHNSGYLFIPPSGTNGGITWNVSKGTFGAVVDNDWMNVLGSNNYVLGNTLQTPTNAVASAGKYNFSLLFAPQGGGRNKVTFSLVKADNSYSFKGEVFDNHNPLVTNKINAIIFGLNSGNTTTALKIADVKVDLVTHATSVEKFEDGTVPRVYSLHQNYPNPFNPSTIISYDLPRASKVNIKVYDLLGRLVTTLVNETQESGRYKITWNAGNTSTGVYFYQIDATSLDGAVNYSAVKKLMLIK